MPRRSAFVVLALAVALAWAAPLILPSAPVRAQGQAPDMARVRPNYDLASRWTASKVNNKLVFSVVGDAELVRERRPLLVHVLDQQGPPLDAGGHGEEDEGAALRHGRTWPPSSRTSSACPFDSGHLPLSSVRLIKKDAVLQFEVAVPKDTKIPGIVEKGEDKRDHRGPGAAGGREGRRRRPAPPPRPQARRAISGFEYDLATAKLALVHPDEVRAKAEKDKEVKWPSWASVSPDEKTAVFVRNFDLYMMDMENLKKAIKDPRDPSLVETRLTQDGAEHYTWSRHMTDEEKDRLRKEQKKEEKKTEAQKAEEKKAEQKKVEAKKEEEKDTFEPRVSPIGPDVEPGLEEVHGRAARLAQGQGPVGHRRPGAAAAEAGDLPLLDARRGHPARGHVHLRRPDQAALPGEVRRVQGPAADRGDAPRDRQGAEGPRGHAEPHGFTAVGVGRLGLRFS